MKNFLILVLAFLIFASCNRQKKKQEVRAMHKTGHEATTVFLSRQQFQLAEIRLGSLKDTVISDEITANGLIDVPPQNFATVSAPMGGYVRSTQVLPGMNVSKGQMLSVLEHQDYIQMQQDYLQALSRLELTDKEFLRQKELYQENASSSRKFQSSDADYKSTQALVRSLEEKLKLLGIDLAQLRKGEITPKIFIRSPIAGNVKSVNVSIGKFVSPSDIMYEIVDNSHQHLELKVFEKDILKVKEDQKIIFTIPTVGNEKFEGVVYLVGRSLDNTSRSITIHGHLEKEDKERLLPGMYVNGLIIAGDRHAVILPDEAVILQNREYYIFEKLGENKDTISFRKINVKTGLKREGWVEILPADGFPSIGDTGNLVLKGAYSINAKLKNIGGEE
jgi:RND family efflux transporter MFP subunit